MALQRESKRDHDFLNTAKDFISYGLKLSGHLTGSEISELENANQMKLGTDERCLIAKIETKSYQLEFNYFKELARSEADLKNLALSRLEDLKLRAQIMQLQLMKAQQLLGQGVDIKTIITIISSKRDVIDPKKPDQSASD